MIQGKTIILPLMFNNKKFEALRYGTDKLSSIPPVSFIAERPSCDFDCWWSLQAAHQQRICPWIFIIFSSDPYSLSQLWSPSKVGDIQEDVQRAFTRRIWFRNGKEDYWQRLSKFHPYYSLEKKAREIPDYRVGQKNLVVQKISQFQHLVENRVNS